METMYVVGNTQHLTVVDPDDIKIGDVDFAIQPDEWGASVRDGAVRVASRKFAKFGVDATNIKVIAEVDFEHQEFEFEELHQIGLTEGALIAAVRQMVSGDDCKISSGTRVKGLWLDLQKRVDCADVLGHLSDMDTEPVPVERTDPEEKIALQEQIKTLKDRVSKLQVMAGGRIFSTDPEDASLVAEFKEVLLQDLGTTGSSKH